MDVLAASFEVFSCDVGSSLDCQITSRFDVRQFMGFVGFYALTIAINVEKVLRHSSLTKARGEVSKCILNVCFGSEADISELGNKGRVTSRSEKTS
jgi:hypothetical protein